MSISAAQATYQVNLLINKLIGGGLTAAQVNTVLTTQSAALVTADTPVGTIARDRTIKDPGTALTNKGYF